MFLYWKLAELGFQFVTQGIKKNKEQFAILKFTS